MRLIDLINKYPEKTWEFCYLSCNPMITFEDILNNPDKPWSWSVLASNRFGKVNRFARCGVGIGYIMDRLN